MINHKDRVAENKGMDSFFWFDYETFGLDVARDRPVQFGGLRTNLELIPIEDPIRIFARPTEDYLPNPGSCLITGITPAVALERGVPENQFIAQILREMSRAGTCNVGYNNLRFDDELTRHTLYRNLMDPFSREWRDGNSRWDLLNVVRATRALRPEGLEWPLDSEGRPTLKLDLLTAANGISHEHAHDALSDVLATLALAKLVREKQPRLFAYLFELRRKARVLELVGTGKYEPFLWISTRMSIDSLNLGMVVVVGRQPANPNALIVYDLGFDPDRAMEEVSPDPGEGQFSPFSLLHINRAPSVAPVSSLRMIDQQRLDFDLDKRQRNLRRLKQLSIRKAPGYEILSKPNIPETLPDIDLALYAGGFASERDRKLLEAFRQPESEGFLEIPNSFDNQGYRELCRRYRARNYPERLSEDEKAEWRAFCELRHQGVGGFLSVEEYKSQICALRGDPEMDAGRGGILDELDAYPAFLSG